MLTAIYCYSDLESDIRPTGANSLVAAWAVCARPSDRLYAADCKKGEKLVKTNDERGVYIEAAETDENRPARQIIDEIRTLFSEEPHVALAGFSVAGWGVIIGDIPRGMAVLVENGYLDKADGDRIAKRFPRPDVNPLVLKI